MARRNHLETKAGTACPGPAMQQAEEEVSPPIPQENDPLRGGLTPERVVLALDVTPVCPGVAVCEDPVEPCSLVTQLASFQAVI